MSRSILPTGSLTAVIGPNGAGKTTFFNLISGAIRPDAGAVLLDGDDIAGRSPPEIVRRGIGRAFQVASIFPSLTVQETMLAAVSADQRRAGVLHRRFPLARDAATAPSDVMELLGLADKRNRTAATLSHGDQKLLDIALALVLEPSVLLLDEPTAGMGPEERWRMIDKVRELWERAEDHAGLHRARHGHRVQDRADDPRALLRPRAGRRHAGRDPQQSGRHRSLSRHRACGSRAHERPHPVRGRRHRRLLRRRARSCSASVSRVRQGETMALLGRNGAGKITTHEGDRGARAAAARPGSRRAAAT